MQKEDTSWFASWFDSPYYHVLYKDRDDSEAARKPTSYFKEEKLA